MTGGASQGPNSNRSTWASDASAKKSLMESRLGGFNCQWAAVRFLARDWSRAL
jgi:hypothetical protein